MDTKIASLCVLAFERPNFLEQTIASLHSAKAGYPFELIVHNDASKDPQVKRYLDWLSTRKLVSFVIENCGKNMGLGHAMRRCVGASHGDYIFKLDSDLTFEDDWLKNAVELLEKPKVGCVCLLDYRNYDPEDERFHQVQDKGEYFESNNFVSSAYGFKRETYEKHGDKMGNDGWHRHLHNNGYKLLITKPDMVKNTGFGKKNSVWINSEIHDKPLIF